MPSRRRRLPGAAAGMRPRAASPRPLGARRSAPAAADRAADGAAGGPPGIGAGEPSALRRVLVDGRNVQHAFERGSAPGSVPTGTLISSLRAAFPPPTEVELILDGHRGGSPTGKISPGFSVQFTRHASADQVIGDRVAEAFRALGPAGAWSVLVVTDDREVRDHARRNGARVEGTVWLAGRVAARSGASRGGASIGQGRAPRPPGPPRPSRPRRQPEVG